MSACQFVYMVYASLGQFRHWRISFSLLAFCS